MGRERMKRDRRETRGKERGNRKGGEGRRGKGEGGGGGKSSAPRPVLRLRQARRPIPHDPPPSLSPSSLLPSFPPSLFLFCVLLKRERRKPKKKHQPITRG